MVLFNGANEWTHNGTRCIVSLALYMVMCMMVFNDMTRTHVHRDTAGQERFHTITTSYYRGAMVKCLCVCEGGRERESTITYQYGRMITC